MNYDKPWESQILSAFLRANSLKPSVQDVVSLRSLTSLAVADAKLDTYKMGGMMTFSGWEGNFQGGVSISYHTSNLKALFAEIVVPTIHAYNPHTTRELAAIFIAQYGLPYDVEWFVDAPFNAKTMPTHVTLETIRTEYTAPSQLTVRVERSVSDIAELFSNTILDALVMPFDPQMRSSPIATYGIDFTPFYDDEKALFKSALPGDTLYRGDVSAVDDPNGRLELFNYLTSRFGSDVEVINTDPNEDSIDKINLMGFYVRYNGVTANAKYGNISANTLYDRVLVLESAAPTNLTNYDGPLFIHYNNA